MGRLQAWVNSGALRAGTPSPIDDYWYEPYPGGGSSSGVRVSADSAKRISAVFACVSIISRNVATLPLKLYQERSDGGKEVASRHPLYDVLYSTPNRFQTSSEFRQMMQGHFELRGNAYAEITPGTRGFADQLIPMHPDRVVVTVDSRGMPVYKYSDPRTNQSRTLVSEEVFHLKGWSDDGITGQSTLALGADVFGVAIAAQDYSARYFANDATPPVYITGANFKDDAARDKFKENLQREQTGRNRHKAAVLPIGLDIKSLDIKASDAQLLEARKYSRIEICSMFGVPPHMIGETDKAATYASVEQFNISFAVQCLLPRLVTWEQAITRDLIIVPKYFPKFSMAALLRGNTAERFAAYKIAIENGWMCQDDVRMLEDMNPIPNGVGAKFWRPLNWAPLEQLENPKQQQPDPTADPAKALAMEGRIKLLASCAAEPCVRKEINEVRRLHERCQAKEFRSAVGDFYRKHANFLADRMHLPLDVAKEYCDRNSGWIVDAAESAEIGTQLNFDQLLNQGMQWLGEKAAEVSIQ